MKSMRVFLAAAVLLGVNNAAFAQAADPGVQVVNTDKLGLNIYGRMQMLGAAENVPDHVADHNRVYLFMKQARLGVKGRYEDLFKYDLQLGFGGEDANGSNTDLSLLDMVGDVPIKQLGENTVFKIGQFRVPYSREGLTDRGYMEFAERSIANLASYQGRDYGIALMDRRGNFTGTVGTFSSGGRDVPQRYLPERIGVPELVARVGWDDGVDEDIYHVMGTDRSLKRTVKAIYLNGIYQQDTRIGHSTALNLRTVDKNLLIDSNYNPYISRGDGNVVCSAISCERGNLYFLGGDAAIRHPMGTDEALEGELEGNWGGYQNRFGVIHIASGRAQGQYRNGRFEAGLRYAVLSMDSKAGFISTTAPGQPFAASAGKPILATNNSRMGAPIHEITPSLSWHFRDHNLKVTGDLPIYVNCPVFIDQVDGAYAFPDATSVDQNTVLATAGNNTVRRIVTEARMLFQFMF